MSRKELDGWFEEKLKNYNYIKMNPAAAKRQKP